MDVSVDRERCIGAGMCALTALDVFDQDADGRVLLRDPVPPRAYHAAVREAGQICPAGAIAVLDR